MILSFVIPAFNCAPFLSETLDSILSQGLPSTIYEVIIINDGSSDNTEFIAKNYCIKHNNFRNYSQENKGVAYTRNKGLSLARGKYIHFMDADDRLLPGGMKIIIENLISTEIGPDIITFYSQTIESCHKSNKEEVFLPYKQIFSGSTSEYASRFGIGLSVWNNLFSREFLLNYNLKFKSFKIAEDMLFMLDAFNIPNSWVVATNLNIYRYIVRKESAINNLDTIHLKAIFIDLIKVIEKLRNFKKTSNIPVRIIDSHIHTCQRWAFTRLSSAILSYMEVKRMLSDAHYRKIFPVNAPGKVFTSINIISSNAFFTFIFSRFYRFIFIPFIKPFISRN